MLIANKQICNGNEYYYSNDEGVNWIKINLPLSYQYVSKFSAGINEALYLNNCS
ncbi:MAG: hypothetical protein IPL95_08965 [Saprospiraceae bacterium]|nr:hypothetical protein [Saprospiraceae bacterium]